MIKGNVTMQPANWCGYKIMRLSEAEINLFYHPNLSEVEKLLFQVYCQEQDWFPAPLNPSGLIVKELEGEKYLTDNLANSAIWFGVLSEDRIVACHRIVLPNDKNKLEVELYQKFTPVLAEISNVCELNRLAVDCDFRRTPVLLLLLLYEFEWMRQIGISRVYTTAKFPEPGEMFVKLGLEYYDHQPFTYEERDKNKVKLLFADINMNLEKSRLFKVSQKIIESID